MSSSGGSLLFQTGEQRLKEIGGKQFAQRPLGSEPFLDLAVNELRDATADRRGAQEIADALIEMPAQKIVALRSEKTLQVASEEIVSLLPQIPAQLRLELRALQIGEDGGNRLAAQDLDEIAKAAGVGRGDQRRKGTEFAVEEGREFLPQHRLQFAAKSAVFQRPADIGGGQKMAADHLAHFFRQFPAFGRYNSRGERYPQAKDAPGAQRAKKHADSDMVGHITDESTENRRQQVGKDGLE